MNLTEILTGAHVALRLIQSRLITVLALLMTGGLYGWAMATQTVLGAIIAAVWGLSIFLPVLFTGRGGYDATSQGRSQRSGQSEESQPGGADGS